MRAAIVADDPWARAGIEAALAADPAIVVVGGWSPAAWSEGRRGGWLGSMPRDPDTSVAVGVGPGADVLVWDAPVAALPAEAGELAGAHLLLLVDEERADGPGPVDPAWAFARGVLGRAAPPARLAAAVVALGRGLQVGDPELTGRGAVRGRGAWGSGTPTAADDERADGAREPPPEGVTPREREVLELLASGATNKDAALALDISEHTVKFHVASLLSKFGASSRTELVVLAAQLGVLRL